MTPLPWWVTLYDKCEPGIVLLIGLGVMFIVSYIVMEGAALAGEVRSWFE